MKIFSFDVDWSFLEAPMAPALAAGLLAIIGCAVCLVLLRLWRLTSESNQAAMRSEFNEMIRGQRTEYSEEVARLGRQLTLLEASAQDVDRLTHGFSRPLRAQALALLRSGTPHQQIAHDLNIGRQEMRLITHVAGILLPE